MKLKRLQRKDEMPCESLLDVQCDNKRACDRNRSPAKLLSDVKSDDGMNRPERTRPSSIHETMAEASPSTVNVPHTVGRLARVPKQNSSRMHSWEHA